MFELKSPSLTMTTNSIAYNITCSITLRQTCQKNLSAWNLKLSWYWYWYWPNLWNTFWHIGLLLSYKLVQSYWALSRLDFMSLTLMLSFGRVQIRCKITFPYSGGWVSWLSLAILSMNKTWNCKSYHCY